MMKYELSVWDMTGHPVVVAAAVMPFGVEQSVRRLVRRILNLPIPPDRAAARLLWGFFDLADKDGGAVLASEPDYSGCTITVAFAERMVYIVCEGRKEEIEFDAF